MPSIPTVSVIIPTYNRPDFTLDAIDSVLRQTFEDFELIVVNDGGEESNTLLKCMSDDDRLSYFYVDHGGVSFARNFGVSKSRGRLIAFLDSDDLWLPKKLEVQTFFFDKNSDVNICQTEEIWIRNGKRVNPAAKHKKYSGWIFKKCLPLCIVSPSAVMMKKGLFDSLGGFDESLPACEDYDLWLRLSLRHPIYTLSEPLIIKRGGHKNQLSSMWGLDRYRIKSLVNLLNDVELDGEKRNLVEKEISRRACIFAKGAKKHGKYDEANYYKSIMDAYDGKRRK